ncbi:ATP-binding protein [Paenibacillus sp. TRM 82003]|uniref:ATP-binding protein n=1 Tax=Kineococcus sp. TRM81007 TaxID=2925831 RepID=UPI001F58AC31|nr:ATP-binding protein [Kineococcus sp. TRM81007]MCI2238392.1 ATP-binding protein [Kineococcus sp. TRM81007]MCI3922094.1 ATP-binding protein [Paenibacillus sp. TRM 82003]
MTARSGHRIVALVLALAVLSLVPTVVSASAGRGPRPPAPWSAPVLTAYAVLLVLLLAQAAHGRPRPWLPWALVVLGDAALATWPLVVPGRAEQAPWVLALSPLTVGAGAVAAGLGTALGLGLVHVGLRALVQVAGVWVVPPVTFALDALLVLVVVPAVWVAVAAVRSSGARLEQARLRAEDAAARGSAARAAELENTRWDAIVHDDVLAALTTTAQAQDPAGRAEARDAARTALARVEGERPTVPPAALPVARVWAQVAHAVRDLHPGALLDGPGDGGGGDALDPEAAEALRTATAELVRNAVRHGADGTGAPPPLRVRARVRAGTDGGRLLVEVRDAGPGFPTRSPAAWRLGLAVSVHGRVRAVGGAACLRSWPGTGTCVLLSVPVLPAASTGELCEDGGELRGGGGIRR